MNCLYNQLYPHLLSNFKNYLLAEASLLIYEMIYAFINLLYGQLAACLIIKVSFFYFIFFFNKYMDLRNIKFKKCLYLHLKIFYVSNDKQTFSC